MKKENNELFIQKYIVPYFKGLKLCEADSEGVRNCGASITANDVRYFLPNGTSMAIVFTNNELYVMIDINGIKGPNKQGYDEFYFITQNHRLLPAGWFDGITREDILNGYSPNDGYSIIACRKNANPDIARDNYREGCTALLMLDGWEIKDDYPW